MCTLHKMFNFVLRNSAIAVFLWSNSGATLQKVHEYTKAKWDVILSSAGHSKSSAICTINISTLAGIIANASFLNQPAPFVHACQEIYNDGQITLTSHGNLFELLITSKNIPALVSILILFFLQKVKGAWQTLTQLCTFSPQMTSCWTI